MGHKASLIFLAIMFIGCNYSESRPFEQMDMLVTTTNGQICQLCEEYTTKAIVFLSQNETRAEIIHSLNQACSHIYSFEPQCNSLVDYYVPLFFADIEKIQPKWICEKANLCKEMPMVQLVKHDDPCIICHNAVNELLTKLEDPEMQLDVIHALLKVCDKVENYSHQASQSLVVSGPLWTGPLHNTAYVFKMLELAKEWGWACNLKKFSDLGNTLNQMIDESDPHLPSGYIKLDEISSRAKIDSPPVNAILSALRKEGYIACRSHIEHKAIKTNCPIAECIEIARELRFAVLTDNLSISR